MSKLVKKNNFYYLKKQFKENSKVVVKEKYLGKEIPENILKLKEEFENKIYKLRFENQLQQIQQNYSKKFKGLPKIAQIKELQDFAVQFTYNSQKIEGSTLSLMDTKLLVENNIAPQKEIKYITESYEHHKIFLEMLNYTKNISLDLIFMWHKKMFEQTYPSIAERVREHNVTVSGSKSKFAKHIEIQYLLEEYIEWYNTNSKKYNPVILAALIHLKFVTIHPYSDGNGRMSRFLMNFVLHRHNYPMIDIDYTNRKSYYLHLEKSQVSKEEDYFVEFLVKKYLKRYKNYI